MEVIALGLWFHDGKSQADMALVSLEGEPKVIFGDVPLDAQFAHGFLPYLPLLSGGFKLLLDSHYTNRNVDNGYPISMSQVAGNLWMEEKKKIQVLYLHHVNYSIKFYDELEVSSQKIGSRDYVHDELNFHDLHSVHSVLHWLHPGCEPSYVALRKIGQIMKRNDDGTWQMPGGMWQSITVEGKSVFACHWLWKKQ